MINAKKIGERPSVASDAPGKVSRMASRIDVAKNSTRFQMLVFKFTILLLGELDFNPTALVQTDTRFRPDGFI